MKEILLKVDDSVFEQIMGMFGICQGVEVVSCLDITDEAVIVNQCVAKAIEDLQNDKKTQFMISDHALVMMLINQGLVGKKLFFSNPLDYIKYLVELGAKDVPGKSRLYFMLNITRGQYPNWTFTDTNDTGETTRRNNVGKRFLSSFLRARRAIVEGLAEKSGH